MGAEVALMLPGTTESIFSILPIGFDPMEKFMIPTRHGLLEITIYYPNGCRCLLTPPEEHTSVPDRHVGFGQFYHPFENRMETVRYTRKIEAICLRVWPLLSQMPMHRHMLLEFCIKGGRQAIELFEDCPALALLLAMRVSSDHAVRLQEQLVELAGKKRIDILHYCRFPRERWVVKLLKKIPLVNCSSHLLKELKEILLRSNRKQIAMLRHLPAMNRLVVSVLCDEQKSSLVANSFYASAASCRWSREAENLFDEIIRMSSQEGAEGLSAVPRMRTVYDLPRIHDKLTEQHTNLRRARRSGIFAITFPKPPFPGIDNRAGWHRQGIFPLRSGRDLYIEGLEMKHCIASYAEKIVKSGNLYAYHICSREGEKATALIAKETLTWKLFEIQGIANSDVSPDLLRYVEDWLARENSILEKKYDKEKIVLKEGDRSNTPTIPPGKEKTIQQDETVEYYQLVR